MFRIVVMVAAWALAVPALAQGVFKCTADGKIEYRDRPCDGGAGVALHVPPAAPPLAAQDAAKRDREALLELEKLRVSQELRAERQRASGEREARAEAREQRAVDAQRKRCAKLRLRQKWSDQDHARLSGSAADAAAVKARRQAEELAVECPA
ncbi:MAG: DUF4124 domain-containing protein [Telluria sp.]